MFHPRIGLKSTPFHVALLISLLVLVSCSGGGGSAQSPPPDNPPAFPAITLTSFAAGFNQPVNIAHAGDGSGRMFVVERAGVIKLVRNGTVSATPFLDISGLVQSAGGEQGLLGIAFPPGFSAKQYFYVDYTGLSGVTGDTVIARYPVSVDPDVADPAGGITIISQAQPFANHNGGHLAFGPDGLLYVALGDGGSGGDPFNNAQNLAVHLGKILRIDVEAGSSPYAIPASNPFNSEVWAYGLRNPWRFSFDRGSGDLYIADVGQNQFEEVNFQPSASSGGENYGWNIMEGMHCFTDPACSQAGLTLPVAEYDHLNGDCSVTGGFVYRGAQYPSLQGIYLYGDFCSGRIWGLRRNGLVWENQLLLDTTLNISSFGEDEAGNLYVADMTAGVIYKIVVP
ncbi:MAG: glucose dehydrogenase [Deltaproteobacteria bacterium]|nr:glucose dehydrogenase [Deltaproteobacteria bacterium]TLN05263.1 MAG: PQQ-dependent sugar dehydrogenase [bacterium]